jgi:adenylyl-sulfate kinase
MIIWFTGLSGSGKSTLAEALSLRMKADGIRPLMVDGDVMRLGLASDLGFTIGDRSENVRRAGGAAILASKSGIVSICSLISPLRKDREIIRTMSQAQGVPFIEIFVNTPLEVCERRDPKGLYKKAREGKIPDFTGIGSPYEPPLHPELNVKTSGMSVEDSLREIYRCISGVESYASFSGVGRVGKLLARVSVAMEKIIPERGSMLRQMAPWVIPPAYLVVVMLIDYLLPMNTITPPLLGIGLMTCGLTLRPKHMIF